MLLGKRPRHQIKRTTSMTEFSFDLNTTTGESQALDPHQNPFNQSQIPAGYGGGSSAPQRSVSDIGDQRFVATTVSSPRNNRRSSVDFVETSNFLRSCFLCKRRLVPGRDIYMYRGDTAFCSHECRQQQMNLDERKEKCSFASKKETPSSAAGSEVSAKSGTVAAV